MNGHRQSVNGVGLVDDEYLLFLLSNWGCPKYQTCRIIVVRQLKGCLVDQRGGCGRPSMTVLSGRPSIPQPPQFSGETTNIGRPTN